MRDQSAIEHAREQLQLGGVLRGVHWQKKPVSARSPRYATIRSQKPRCLMCERNNAKCSPTDCTHSFTCALCDRSLSSLQPRVGEPKDFLSFD